MQVQEWASLAVYFATGESMRFQELGDNVCERRPGANGDWRWTCARLLGVVAVDAVFVPVAVALSCLVLFSADGLAERDVVVVVVVGPDRLATVHLAMSPVVRYGSAPPAAAAASAAAWSVAPPEPAGAHLQPKHDRPCASTDPTWTLVPIASFGSAAAAASASAMTEALPAPLALAAPVPPAVSNLACFGFLVRSFL